MLRGGAEGGDLLAADGEEDAARGRAEGGGGLGHVGDAGPAVAGRGLPGRAFEDDERDAGGGGGAGGVGGDGAGEGVGGVDQDGVRPGPRARRRGLRRRRSRRCGPRRRRTRGARVRPASDRVTRRPGRAARAVASSRASPVPPRMRTCMRPSSELAAAVTNPKWLAVVGIGEDGVAGLGEAARRHIAEAEVVFGGRRHLGLAAPLIRGEARAWRSPFDPAMAEVVALRGRRGLRAGLGRSVPERGRRDAGALRRPAARWRWCRRPRRSASRRRGSAGRCRRSRRSRCTGGRSRRSGRCCIPGRGCSR